METLWPLSTDNCFPTPFGVSISTITVLVPNEPLVEILIPDPVTLCFDDLNALAQREEFSSKKPIELTLSRKSRDPDPP